MAQYQDRSHTQTQAAHHNPNQKAGLMDKVKEKIPGGQTHTQTGHTGQTHTQTGYTGQTGHTQTGHTGQTAYSNPTQKPGLVAKVKGMIPGSQAQSGYSSSTQKPGLVNKIKAKIPGLQNKY